MADVLRLRFDPIRRAAELWRRRWGPTSQPQSMASATNIVQRLEAQGLVSRSPNPRDGRGTLAAITDSGREVMEAATADLVQGGFGLSMLTTDEHDQLFALLRKVRVAREDFAE